MLEKFRNDKSRWRVDEISNERIYSSNVFVFDSIAGDNVIRHPVFEEEVFGDKHHLMSRRRWTDLPGSLWAEGMSLVNFLCRDRCDGSEDD